MAKNILNITKFNNFKNKNLKESFEVNMTKLQNFRKIFNRKLDEIFRFFNFVLSLKIKQIVLKHYKV